MAISEQRSHSIYALDNLLKDVIKNPGDWIDNIDLIASLKAQGKLSKWSDSELGIIPSSLNTLKTASDSQLDDGFAGLDRKRGNALLAIEREISKNSKPKSGSKLQLEEKIKELASQVTLLEQRNMTFTYFIKELQALAVKYASQSNSEGYRAKCQRELQIIQAKLSFTGEYELILEQPNNVE